MLPKPVKRSLLSTIMLIVVVAILYTLTGYLGLYLATPPGYATPIWIPSGIALGAVLIWGLRCAPGILLGSFITNLYVSTQFGFSTNYLFPSLIAAVIAVGAMIQAMLGWLLIKKKVGLQNILIYPNDILLFALLSGPLSCLFNTTWSNTILLLLHVLSADNYLLSWTTWWIGDSMGALIYTPVFLILFAKPEYNWRQRILPILLPLCASFTIVISAFFVVHSVELKHIKSMFELIVDTTLLRIENDLLMTEIKQPNSINKNNIKALISNEIKNLDDLNSIAISNITNPNHADLLYLYNKKQILPLSESYLLTFQRKINIGNQIWLVKAVPSSDYIIRNFSWLIWMVLFVGLLFCTFINIILFITHGQKSVAEVEMKEKNSALENAESKNLLLLNAAGEGIYGVDLNGLATFINPTAAKMFGFRESELIGKSMHFLTHHSHPDHSPYMAEDCPVFAAFRHDKAQRVDNEVFWRKDGTKFWVEYTVTPVKENDRTNGAVVVFADVSERHNFELELERMAHYDTLTSLPNRFSFFNHLQSVFKSIEYNENELIVCFIDLDNFKQINDMLGHSIGDETLIIVTQILMAELNSHGYLARLGGDEFGVILKNIQSKNELITILERTVSAASKHIYIQGREINISTSIGVASFPTAGKTPEELVMNADIAMYHAKELGKNTYVFFDEKINEKVKRHNQIDMQMRNALTKKEFSLYYQVQVDAQRQKIIGIETLLRWHNSELNTITPSEFIPIAESTKLIIPIGEWIIKQACSDYNKIISVFHGNPLILSINVSAVQLENFNFIDILKRVLSETQMKGENLLLEITETAFMKNPDHTLKIMLQIEKLGVHFALDDFGVNYSSMQYLKNLPISLIKIDQGFVSDMTTDMSDFKIINAIIKLSHAIGISTIAEGVETQEQFNALKKNGLHFYARLLLFTTHATSSIVGLFINDHSMTCQNQLVITETQLNDLLACLVRLNLMSMPKFS